MFSMILAVGQGPPPPPNPFKKSINQHVFHDFGGGAGAHRLPRPQKTIGIFMFSMTLEEGPGPCHLPPACDHYGQVVRKPDPDLVPNLVPTLCQAPPTRFSMGWGRGVLPPSRKILENL